MDIITYTCWDYNWSMSVKGDLRDNVLTHWGRVTHICVGKQTIIGSDNGLSPGRRQAIIWTNAGILLIGPFRTNFSEISIKIITFSFTKMRLNVSSAKWHPFCLGLNVLTMARCIARPSAAMILTMKDKHVLFCHLISHEEWFCSTLSKNVWKYKYIFMFPEIDSAEQGSTQQTQNVINT